MNAHAVPSLQPALLAMPLLVWLALRRQLTTCLPCAAVPAYLQAKKSSKKQQLLQKMVTGDLTPGSITIGGLDSMQQQKQQQQGGGEGGTRDEATPLLMGMGDKQGPK